jgi:sulfate permease, SulP family
VGEQAEGRQGMGPRLGGWLRSIKPSKSTVGKDAVAGIPGAVGSVPDGMAAAILAGVNPVYGLYASFAGPIAGGVAASTRLMVITTTSAAALAAGSAIAGIPAEERAAALFMLTIIAGILMVAAGLVKLGRYTRFVSLSVMKGFLTGVAVNIVCGQIPDLLGVPAEGDFALAKGFNALIHAADADLTSVLVGLGALAILLLLMHTRLATYGAVVALIIPTVATLWSDTIQRVSDVGDIPSGFPLPHLPDFGQLLSAQIWIGAVIVAVIVLVQGAGVSEGVPNPDGSTSNINQDFVAQGTGNIASGFFRGQPVGGSVGQTALNVAAGARTRWASIFSGVWMLVILVALSGVVGKVAIPTLAAVLIFAAAGSIRPAELKTVWKAGLNAQIAMTSTFLATLFLPIAVAVGVGVVISLLLQLNREAIDLSVVELVPQPDGHFVERPAPATLRSHEVALLDVYGSLYYAGAKTLEARLPDPVGAERPAVVLRLRGRTALGATAFAILERYAGRVEEAGGRFFLAGVQPALLEQLHRAGRIGEDFDSRVFAATDTLGESSDAAYQAAQEWVAAASAAPANDSGPH